MHVFLVIFGSLGLSKGTMNTQTKINLSSFSFGGQGTDASEHELTDLKGILYFNTSDPEFARLKVLIPKGCDSKARWALGFDPQLQVPPVDIHLAVKFTTPSRLTVWFPNCISHANAEETLKLEAYTHREPSGEGWWAEINGVRQAEDLSQSISFAEQDIVVFDLLLD